jgi:filamentous hemagglutinin
LEVDKDMNTNHHHLVFNRKRGCLMAVAETAMSSGKASGSVRPRSKEKSKTQTCRKARSTFSSGDMWLQANQSKGYSLPCLQGSFNSALSRSQYEGYAPSQLRADPVAPLLAFSGMPLAFGVSPQLFAASQNQGGNVTIAAQRSTSTLDAQDSGSKGGIGGKSDTKTTGFEQDITSSTITGGNVSIVSQGGNVILEAANVESKNNLNISAVNGAVAILSATSESYFQTDKKESNVAVQRTSGSGNYDKNVVTTKLTGNLVIDTNKIIADLPASKGMEELAKQPGMAWINTIQNDPALAGKVDWKKIDDAHKNWSYDKQGLSPAGAAILSLAVAYFSGGTMSGFASTLTSNATMSAALTAGMTSLASQAAVALVNNGGDLGKTLSQLGSSESLRGLAMSMVTAGALQGLSDYLPKDIASATAKSPFTDQLTKNLINNAASATIRSALTGTSLEDNLKSSIVDAIIITGMAQGANAIGDAASQGKINEFGRAVAHAVVGCLAGAAKAQSGDGCSAGAVGAVVGELAAQFYNDGTGTPKTDTTQFAALMSGVAGALVGGDAR